MQRRKRKLLRSAPYNRGARVHNCHCLSHLAELETECNDDKKQALQTLRRTLTTDHVNALQTIHHVSSIIMFYQCNLCQCRNTALLQKRTSLNETSCNSNWRLNYFCD